MGNSVKLKTHAYFFRIELKISSIEDVWVDVKELRDHNQERYDFNPEAWDEHEVNVGIFLTKILKIKVRNLLLYGKNHYFTNIKQMR